MCFDELPCAGTPVAEVLDGDLSCRQLRVHLRKSPEKHLILQVVRLGERAAPFLEVALHAPAHEAEERHGRVAAHLLCAAGVHPRRGHAGLAVDVADQAVSGREVDLGRGLGDGVYAALRAHEGEARLAVMAERTFVSVVDDLPVMLRGVSASHEVVNVNRVERICKSLCGVAVGGNLLHLAARALPPEVVLVAFVRGKTRAPPLDRAFRTHARGGTANHPLARRLDDAHRVCGLVSRQDSPERVTVRIVVYPAQQLRGAHHEVATRGLGTRNKAHVLWARLLQSRQNRIELLVAVVLETRRGMLRHKGVRNLLPLRIRVRFLFNGNHVGAEQRLAGCRQGEQNQILCIHVLNPIFPMP